MNLYIIRHGDPNYKDDTLTEKGWREAALLAERLKKIPCAAYYVSPLGRAQDTASLTLRAVGREAQTLPWLQEFPGESVRADSGFSRRAWDRYPAQWANDPLCYDRDHWMESDLYAGGNAWEEYQKVTKGLDALLEKHGYVRDGELYRAERPNRDNIMLFCHYGITCVLLSHLLGVSPVILWHHTVSLTTSVTVLTTEERQEGIALFRMSRFSDISHLEAAGEEPSFSARFCETFDSDERHN